MTRNAQELRAQWSSLRALLKERWTHLTDEDLSVLEGDIDQLVSRVQQKTGEAREAIEAFLAGVTARATATIVPYAQEAGDRLRERIDKAEDLVRQKPGPSLTAAFGCGLAAGLILGLMIRSR
ncbi:MAG: hypothetical protein P4L84_31985 [Isosphaeraceae bacterium]|nr:hypothetical protein [Isosphaeraceae bacterium]